MTEVDRAGEAFIERLTRVTEDLESLVTTVQAQRRPEQRPMLTVVTEEDEDDA